jgi:hypothetical protein
LAAETARVEQEKQAAEAARVAEEARMAAEAARVEQERQAEEAGKAEEARKAAEDVRIEQEKEAARQAEAARVAVEEARQKQEAADAEKARLKLMAEEAEKAEKEQSFSATAATAVPESDLSFTRATWTSAGWTTEKWLSKETVENFRVDEEAVASWRFDPFARRASTGTWVMSVPPVVRDKTLPRRILPGMEPDEELHMPTTPSVIGTPVPEADFAGTALSDPNAPLRIRPGVEADDVLHLPTTPSMVGSPPAESETGLVGTAVADAVEPVVVFPQADAVAKFAAQPAAAETFASSSQQLLDASRVKTPVIPKKTVTSLSPQERAANMSRILKGDIALEQPSAQVDKPWAKRPTSATFLTTGPLMSRLPWDRQPSVGTWHSKSRPSSAARSRPSSAARMSEKELPSAEKTLAPAAEVLGQVLAEVCSCGNVFRPDSIFCRKCGRKREVLNPSLTADSSIFVLPQETQKSQASQETLLPLSLSPRRPQPDMPLLLNNDIVINRDSGAVPNAPWLMRPTSGTWLPHQPLQAASGFHGSWFSRPARGKWMMQAPLDASSGTSKTALAAVESKTAMSPVEAYLKRGLPDATPASSSAGPKTDKAEVPLLPLQSLKQELVDDEEVALASVPPPFSPSEDKGPLPPKLVALRSDALQLEANCREATLANERLRAENLELRGVWNKLKDKQDPQDTPIATPH